MPIPCSHTTLHTLDYRRTTTLDHPTLSTTLPTTPPPHTETQMGEVKFGDLKGTDRNGNQYFENTAYPFGQHRWVEYKVRALGGRLIGCGMCVGQPLCLFGVG